MGDNLARRCSNQCNLADTTHCETSQSLAIYISSTGKDGRCWAHSYDSYMCEATTKPRAIVVYVTPLRTVIWEVAFSLTGISDVVVIMGKRV